MSKVIPGRTDNNLKNRFHNLKRQLQREEDGRLRAPEPEDYDKLVHADRVREVPRHLRTNIEDMWKQERHIGISAAASVMDSREDDKEEEAKDEQQQQQLRLVRTRPRPTAAAPRGPEATQVRAL